MTVYVIANWKMTGSLDTIHEYFPQFSKDLTETPNSRTIIFCPPHPYLSFTVSKCVGTSFHVGAQDCSASREAASTGETSADMIKDVEASYVIIGHSETRERYKYDQATLASKLENALTAGLIPIFCIGESESDYDTGKTKATLKAQLAVLKSLSCDARSILIAYEPIWAIGTGKTPRNEEINDICHWIGEESTKLTDHVHPIIYGGSVKPKNAAEILAMDAIKGVLVGGASLNPHDFAQIGNAVS